MLRYLYIPVFLLCLMDNAVVAQKPEVDSIAWKIDLSDVVVTAQYAPTHSSNAVHDVQTIPTSMMRRRGATNLEQLLLQETNIRIRQDLVLGSSMSLLGTDGQGVKIMIDGVPVIGRQGGNINLSQLNLNQVQRVEIVEGPLAVQYGTDALAGVVNLITQKSQSERLSVTASTQLESAGENVHSLGLGVRTTKNTLLQLDGGFDRFNGVDKDEGRDQLWNPKDQWYGNGSFGYRFRNDGLLRYSLRFFDEQVFNDGDIRRPQYKPYGIDDVYRTRRLHHSLQYTGDVGKKYYLNFVTGLNNYLRNKNTYRNDLESGDVSLVEDQQDTSSFSSFMSRTSIASKYPNAINFQAGFDFRIDKALGKRINDPQSVREGLAEMGDYAVYSTLKTEIGNTWIAEAGIRLAYNTRYSTPVIPSLHVKYQPTRNLILRTSYGRGFRSPDLKELFFDFVDINHYIIGNPDLLAEKSENIQAGVQYSNLLSPSFNLNLSLKGFYNEIHNKIDLYEFMETDDGITPAIDTVTFKYAFFNQDRYKTTGFQFKAGFTWKELEATLNLSDIGYFNLISEFEPGVKKYTFAIETSGDITYHWDAAGLSSSLLFRNYDQRVSFYPSQDDAGEDMVSQRILEGYCLLDASLSKELFGGLLQISSGVKNLLDIQSVSLTGGQSGAHSGSNETSPISPGRSFFVNLTLDFSK